MTLEKNPIQKHTVSQALVKARQTCAYQERCHKEMRNKLYEWGLYQEEVENIISTLITENFLNEERFAKTYAGGKFRIKKWGKIKIKQELKKREISDYCIKKAMLEINDKDYIRTLSELITKKTLLASGGIKRNKKQSDEKFNLDNYKLASYAASKGFEQDLIWDILKNK